MTSNDLPASISPLTSSKQAGADDLSEIDMDARQTTQAAQQRQFPLHLARSIWPIFLLERRDLAQGDSQSYITGSPNIKET